MGRHMYEFTPYHVFALWLQEHRVRRSGLVATLDQQDLGPIDHMLLIDLEADLRGHIDLAPDM